MLIKLTDFMVAYLIKKSIIKSEDIEIYQYGFKILISNIITTLSVIIIGLLSKNIIETIVFLTVFVYIRTYTGGYHATSRIGCYLYTNSVLIFYLLCVKYINLFINYKLLACICIILTELIVFKFAPVKNANKDLLISEVHEYAVKARVSTVIVSVADIITIFFMPKLSEMISLILLIISILMVLELMKKEKPE